jgi:hypothetical protein
MTKIHQNVLENTFYQWVIVWTNKAFKDFIGHDMQIEPYRETLVC